MFGKALLLSTALLALQADAFWRLPCRQRLVLERIDPIDTPGVVGHHVHTVHGGSAFSRNVTSDDLRASHCTSCEVQEDNSAYWTPNLYHQSESGELTALNQTGGMLVYYLLRGENIQPFPPNLRIIAGDARRRNTTYDLDIERSYWAGLGLSTNQDFLRQRAIGFNCLNYAEPANAALGIHTIPQDRDCPDGLRAEVFFPSCWDGKHDDSFDHRSHMAYPSTMDDGDCPEGYPIRVPSLFFETIWDVHAFAGQGGKFIFSTGDELGYSNHGDFMNGWQQDVLERAINTCTDPSGIVEMCTEFTIRSADEYSQCTIESELNEEVWGPMKKLPGCNLITDSTQYAGIGACDADGNDIGTSHSAVASKTSKVVSAASSYVAGVASHTASAASAVVSDVAAAAQDTVAPDAVDPYLVIVTVTETVTEGVTSTTCTAPAVTSTVESYKVKRHMHNHARRHH
ncbi:hypothetical protein FN846DRAFT_900927 [Sphaerosporella brunnea]|uniref:DUF1996 domain-containing protein n=1 Tax=Sphaerosporella brunnea TaxID=1250544 RepID=A0A5J5EGN2_9PEZI|nr:hypothetical protein FN846DRAFT_900927 [Sphaerosporella brunnea]